MLRFTLFFICILAAQAFNTHYKGIYFDVVDDDDDNVPPTTTNSVQQMTVLEQVAAATDLFNDNTHKPHKRDDVEPIIPVESPDEMTVMQQVAVANDIFSDNYLSPVTSKRSAMPTLMVDSAEDKPMELKMMPLDN